MINYHITKDKDNWKLKKEGAKRASKIAGTKSEMMKIIKGGSHSKKPSSVKIHKTDGRIQEERTYPRSSDPKKTKG